MAKHVSVNFSCDICERSLGDKPPISTCRLNAGFEAEWSMEADFNWTDICTDCRGALLKSLSAFKATRVLWGKEKDAESN
jgi:hypothetical protein